MLNEGLTARKAWQSERPGRSLSFVSPKVNVVGLPLLLRKERNEKVGWKRECRGSISPTGSAVPT